jgi:hypothetical protein
VNRPNKKPTLMTLMDGRKVHPLVFLRETHTPAEMGKWLGHTSHATVSIYCNRAKRARTTTIPAEWVLPICRQVGWKPCLLRPDLFLPHWSIKE